MTSPWEIYRTLTADKKEDIENLEEFVPPKKETVIGGLEFLDNYILRAEKSAVSYTHLTLPTNREV